MNEYENHLCGYIRALLSTTVPSLRYLNRISTDSTDTIPIISPLLHLSTLRHTHLVAFKNPISLVILSQLQEGKERSNKSLFS